LIRAEDLIRTLGVVASVAALRRSELVAIAAEILEIDRRRDGAVGLLGARRPLDVFLADLERLDQPEISDTCVIVPRIEIEQAELEWPLYSEHVLGARLAEHVGEIALLVVRQIDRAEISRKGVAVANHFVGLVVREVLDDQVERGLRDVVETHAVVADVVLALLTVGLLRTIAAHVVYRNLCLEKVESDTIKAICIALGHTGGHDVLSTHYVDKREPSNHTTHRHHQHLQ